MLLLTIYNHFSPFYSKYDTLIHFLEELFQQLCPRFFDSRSYFIENDIPKNLRKSSTPSAVNPHFQSKLEKTLRRSSSQLSSYSSVFLPLKISCLHVQ